MKESRPLICTQVFKNGFNKACELFPDGGTCLEFGVAWGNSYLWAVREIKNRNLNMTYMGFDSWQGLPKETKGVWFPDHWKEGSYAAPKNYVLEGLDEIYTRHDTRFILIDGWFKDTLTEKLQSMIPDLVFVNIDVDIHASALEVLDFIEPLLRPNVVIYWDDWMDPVQIPNAPAPWGEHRAWAEWSATRPNIKYEELEVNDVNQRSWRITNV